MKRMLKVQFNCYDVIFTSLLAFYVIPVRPRASKHFRSVAMDSNKDEAERCIKIALVAINNNQQDKARKFLEKAQRLFPTDRAKSTSNGCLFCFGFNVRWWAISVKPNQLKLA